MAYRISIANNELKDNLKDEKRTGEEGREDLDVSGNRLQDNFVGKKKK